MPYLEKMIPLADRHSTTEQFLIVSGHDYRSKRKANLHFIADVLRERGNLRWFSVGFSALSGVKGRDPRLGLEARANKIERFDDVDCYLWRSLIHPFRIPRPLGEINRLTFPLYSASAPSLLDDWVKAAQTIVVESGIPVAFLRRIRNANPQARIIYVASDDLETIGIDPFLIEEFEKIGPLLNGARVTSALLRDAMPKGSDVYFVPHGIDFSIREAVHENPYAAGTLNAVSVGSMLFDPSFFEIAGRNFPQVHFHVIGSGHTEHNPPSNVTYYPEMPFRDTLGYIAHAKLGVAPYQRSNAPYYLADTSMKLMQYELFGLNAICPNFVALDRAGRFGYDPGSEPSIIAAVQRALDTPPVDESVRKLFTWGEVVDRLLDPKSYPDTHLAS